MKLAILNKPLLIFNSHIQPSLVAWSLATGIRFVRFYYFIILIIQDVGAGEPIVNTFPVMSEKFFPIRLKINSNNQIFRAKCSIRLGIPLGIHQTITLITFSSKHFLSRIIHASQNDYGTLQRYFATHF